MSHLRRKIVLLGFMGAGKTTLGKELGVRLGCDAVDLDDRIRSETNSDIAKTIAELGIRYFRRLETRVLSQVLEENGADIISLGGGTWCSSKNRRLISDARCLSLWLDLPFKYCWERIKVEQEVLCRPLAEDHEKARTLFENRRQFYDLADIRLAIGDESSIRSIGEDILRYVQLRSTFASEDRRDQTCINSKYHFLIK